MLAEIHFLHIRSERADAIPLLLTHGWPSSVFEYIKIIPLLSDSFHLVIPSLPGHGFSSIRPGTSIYKTAELFHKLMTQELGYERYAAQGGDWGAYVSSRLGFLYPDCLFGIHLSYVVGGISPFLGMGTRALSATENTMVDKRKRWDSEEGGYEHVHSTKPQTIAFSHWLTGTGGSSVRLYYETRHDPWMFTENDKIRARTAIASFPKELVVSPREWAERIYNVQRWTDMPLQDQREPSALLKDSRHVEMST